jgi:hypothetical protein
MIASRRSGRGGACRWSAITPIIPLMARRCVDGAPRGAVPAA